MATRFPIRLGRRSRPLLRIAFGVTPAKAWVDVGDAVVRVRFGWYELVVPIARIRRYRIEGPWRWITAIGVRKSIRGGDISFAGSPRGGVRLDFREPVRWGPFRLPAAYYGVEDLEGFAAHLAALGIPGEDGRTRGD
jgi:hypothetical protein